MSEINTGGPAFPTKKRVLRDGYAIPDFEPTHGMTLRDYYAGKAMEALIAKSSGQDSTGGKNGVPLIAKYAYEYADAMLKARGT